jgi:hypothetical protein
LLSRETLIGQTLHSGRRQGFLLSARKKGGGMLSAACTSQLEGCARPAREEPVDPDVPLLGLCPYFYDGAGQLAAPVKPPPLPLTLAMALGVPPLLLWPCRKLATALVSAVPPVYPGSFIVVRLFWSCSMSNPPWLSARPRLPGRDPSDLRGHQGKGPEAAWVPDADLAGAFDRIGLMSTLGSFPPGGWCGNG